MKEKKRAERASLRERLSRSLDIPPDLFPGGSLIEIRGQNALSVRGSGTILGYTEEEIRVELKPCILAIRGKRLVCTAYYRGSLGIDGQIESVCFEPIVTRERKERGR